MSISTNSTNGDFTPIEGEVNCESISFDKDGQSDGTATDQQQKEFREKCAKMEMDFSITNLELEKKLLEEKLKHKELMQKTLLERIGELEKQMKQQKNGEQSEYDIVEKIEHFLAQMGEIEKQQSMLCSTIDGVAQQQKANGAVESVTITKVINALKEQQKKMDNFIVTLKERANGIAEKIEEFLAQMGGEMEKQQTMLCSKIDGLVAQQQKANGAVESVTITKINNVLEEQQKKMDNFIVTLKERTNELLNAVHPNIPQPIIAEKFSNPQQNCWDVNACHNDLKIVDSNKMIVHYQKNGNDNWSWRSVFAKHSILPRNYSTNIFYFEISVLNLKSTLFFGFALKDMAKLDEAIHLNTGTFARVSNGNFWIDGTKRGEAQYAYGFGDTVGFGVNLATRKSIFTKNGLLLDTADLSLSAALLFPFISLLSFDDKIEANFGPNFKCDLTAY
ncbi:hypothetical protein niasHS_017182 [Heterodera schachtii]|uniref:B30.2/SPRY domain-containing protein n=1 Tax=Heterodera schachtii TaxID=97005 RepID=A0ABD2I2B8_HETSC